MKRILVGSDLSERATNPLGRAIRLAASTGASLSIIHATCESEDDERCPAVHHRILTEAQIRAEELTDVPLDLNVRISGDSPARAIIEEADRLDADLIVLGGHGAPRFRDALFGTTGTHVVRHACRPVLIVQNDHSAPYARVVIAMAEVATTPIVEAALQLAPAAELHGVHALRTTLAETLAGSEALDRLESQQQHQLQATIVTAGRRVGREISEPHATVRSGEALSILMEETEKLEPDLLVMGTRRRATYLGSHAVDTLFWCPHDILVVPEPAGESM
ncbi:MAG: universal stress protein [Sphingomonas sp.]